MIPWSRGSHRIVTLLGLGVATHALEIKAQDSQGPIEQGVSTEALAAGKEVSTPVCEVQPSAMVRKLPRGLLKSRFNYFIRTQGGFQMSGLLPGFSVQTYFSVPWGDKEGQGASTWDSVLLRQGHFQQWPWALTEHHSDEDAGLPGRMPDAGGFTDSSDRPPHRLLFQGWVSMPTSGCTIYPMGKLQCYALQTKSPTNGSQRLCLNWKWGVELVHPCQAGVPFMRV